MALVKRLQDRRLVIRDSLNVIKANMKARVSNKKLVLPINSIYNSQQVARSIPPPPPPIVPVRPISIGSTPSQLRKQSEICVEI